ncbi:MAG: hypothetical protein COA45_12525 [Zetaproteobacteria bacterium]|nr:MAG: hypothetical protein COA45_12525 [Zetaproteobacteria bacterium]
MFKRKAIEAAGINWEDANTLNEYIYELKKHQVKEIRVEGDLARSKLAWKIEIYSQAMRYRLIELSEVCIEQWNKERFVSCFIFARSIIETVSVLYDFELRLEKALINKDLSVVDDIIMSKTFSSRLEDLFDGRINSKVPSVLTAIDKVDKIIDGVRSEYNRLSEFAHPNYFGVSNAYGKIDYEFGDVSFGNQHNKKNVYMRVQAPIGLLSIANHTFDKIKQHTKLTADLQIAEGK